MPNEKNGYRSWFNRAVVVICFLISTIMGYNYICDAQRATEAKEDLKCLEERSERKVSKLRKEIKDDIKEIKGDMKEIKKDLKDDMKEIKQLIRNNNK